MAADREASEASLRALDQRLAVEHEAQITNRFTQAVGLLGAELANGKPNLEARLGAIYALERIARDSPRDHWAIMEILTAYVRQNAAWSSANHGAGDPDEQKPRVDIQAVITVLGRRNIDVEATLDVSLDLRATDLRGADLRAAHLERSDLRGAHLEGAVAWDIHLEHAQLRDAHLEGADLMDARLMRAKLMDAHLEGTILLHADFDHAHFDGTHLESANLGGATGLTLEQLTNAITDERTDLSQALRH